MVEDSLSEAILDGVVSSGNIAKVDVEDGKIVIRNGGPVTVTADDNKATEPA
jgi:ATP-dependent Clp protease ATP-binding subunit ClpC